MNAYPPENPYNEDTPSAHVEEEVPKKADEDLTPEEIFQFHLVTVAHKLNNTLEANLDAETRLEKLTKIE